MKNDNLTTTAATTTATEMTAHKTTTQTTTTTATTTTASVLPMPRATVPCFYFSTLSNKSSASVL